MNYEITNEMWEEARKWCEEHAEEIESLTRLAKIARDSRHLFLNKYIAKRYEPPFECEGKGEYYVYIWKHNGGAPFYVGSGKGRRAESVSARRDNFKEELSKGDAVLWYIVRGVSEELARKIEHYCSFALSCRGYVLRNSDYNINRMSKNGVRSFLEKSRTEWFIAEINNRLHNILNTTEVDREYAREIAESCKNSYGWPRNGTEVAI